MTKIDCVACVQAEHCVASSYCTNPARKKTATVRSELQYIAFIMQIRVCTGGTEIDCVENATQRETAAAERALMHCARGSCSAC